MPNWTDDEGNNWFGILECKRCLGKFETNDDGEIPPHDCWGARLPQTTGETIRLSWRLFYDYREWRDFSRKELMTGAEGRAVDED